MCFIVYCRFQIPGDVWRVFLLSPQKISIYFMIINQGCPQDFIFGVGWQSLEKCRYYRYSNYCNKGIVCVAHSEILNGACQWVSHNALFLKSRTHSVNDRIYDFDWVFLEFPVKNCIVGMLLTCPIEMLRLRTSHRLEKMSISFCSLLERTRRRNLYPSQDLRLLREDRHHRKMKRWKYTVKSRECLEVRKERCQVKSFTSSTIVSNTLGEESISRRKF